MNDFDVTKILSSHGVRPTQQRIAVYQYLLTHPTHPSADTIYKALVESLPVFSRTTIYNTLNTLVQAGLVRPVTIKADEQCFDANADDHGHFLCVSCGKIFDFEVDSNVLNKLCPDAYKQNRGDIFFTGVCPDCRKHQN